MTYRKYWEYISYYKYFWSVPSTKLYVPHTTVTLFYSYYYNAFFVAFCIHIIPDLTLYFYLLLLLQLCPTLCDPIDGSPPGSAVPGILQARTLEWVAISFSNAGKWKWSRSVVSDFLRPHGLQPTRLLPMGFSRQEYWSGLPFICLNVSYLDNRWNLFWE